MQKKYTFKCRILWNRKIITLLQNEYIRKIENVQGVFFLIICKDFKSIKPISGLSMSYSLFY